MTECCDGNSLTLDGKIDELLRDCSQPTIFAFCGLSPRLAEFVARNECSIPGVVASDAAPFFSPSDFARQKRLAVAHIPFRQMVQF